MNNLFIKNINALSLKNTALAKSLQTFVPTELPKLVQENGAYNIKYKNKLVHNHKNPLAEAIEIFNSCENSPISIHVIFGLGLGYLFQYASLNSKGSVILYEPDLNLIWLAFTLVDFSNDILKENVFFASDLDTVSDAIYKKSGMKNNPTLLSIPSQREYAPEEFDNIVKKLQDIVGAYALDLKYTKEKFYPSLVMLLQNLPNLTNETPLIKVKDSYKGKTAVIVSAGPTLDRNIETLKKYRDRYVLITVGTALKTLITKGLTPDFLCIIETYNSSRQVEGLDLSNVNFITEPYSNPQLRKFKFKNIFSHISANTPINHFWGEICGEEIEEYWSKGTVSYTALNSARILGCSKIILVGQDLAYIEGQCYSKDSAYKDLECRFNNESNKWEIMAKDFDAFAKALSPSNNQDERIATAKRRLANLNASLYYVKGINGENLPTESVYATFITPLSEFTTHFDNIEYINTSMVGAQIDGFKNLPLEDALTNSESFEKKELIFEHNYNKELINNNLKTKLTELKEANKVIEEAFNIIKNLTNNIKRYKSINEEILKQLKKLALNYLSLSSDFASKSKLYDFITTSDKIDLDYEMKITNQFTPETVMNISNKLSKYYTNAKNRILDIERLINEGINTES